ncbi:hypothetical protein LO772_02945 [Yinghuangia sp. ASG 101]|uniref:hypothetical protein n=1 Tax=Yinghuangia sp. ASG 101 TaxID=2896848 RepID=UPI001E577A64|nr:hypothetical protein [Yinghuangia sp. ASG 101]UGQ12589.1 hypothetical protein LO772_02945 [Yinghuangia sp. ASG 101]
MVAARTPCCRDKQSQTPYKIDGRDPAFACTELRQRGPLALPPESCTGPCGIARVMAEADTAWRASLRRVSLADLARDTRAEHGPDALTGTARWLTAAE